MYHDCETEYWQHCLHCVAGDPDAEIIERVSVGGVDAEAKIQYPDGEIVSLVRDVDGWRTPKK